MSDKKTSYSFSNWRLSLNCLKSLLSRSKPMTSAMHGISISSICFLKSASGSFTIRQIRVSNDFEWKGFGTVIYRGLGVGFSGTFLRVKFTWIAASSSSSNCFFSALDYSDCFDLKNFWSAFTAEITCFTSMFFLTSDSITVIFLAMTLAFSFFNLTKSDSNLSESSTTFSSSA